MAVLSPIVTAILNNKIDHIQVLLTVIIINSLKRAFNSLHTIIVLLKLVHLPIFLLKSSARLFIWLLVRGAGLPVVLALSHFKSRAIPLGFFAVCPPVYHYETRQANPMHTNSYAPSSTVVDISMD